METLRTPTAHRRSWLIAGLAVATLFTGATAAQASDPVIVDRAATRKLCQVTGEVDRSTGLRTVNATESRFKFWGTDLGASFEHNGKTVFLFGDTHAAPGLQRGRDRDLIAHSTDRNPDDCLEVDVLTDDDGGYRPLSIATVTGAEFSVPTGGFSAGGRMYVVATTDWTAKTPMGRSVLASSGDDGRNFKYEYDLSTDRFINIAAAKSNPGDRAGLPAEMGGAVLLWGSGDYRKSDAYLAVLPEDRPQDQSGLRYFAGLDPAGSPLWSLREADSAPLFDQPCVGELSVAWNDDLGKYVMLYNCGAPRSQIMVRTADRPWGPWSTAQVLFDAEADGAYCNYMHDGKAIRQAVATGAPCPVVSDPHSPTTAGDPYAPYIVAGFSKGVKGSHSDIYFLMSTWNPYNVVLMKARLVLPQTEEVRQVQTEGGQS